MWSVFVFIIRHANINNPLSVCLSVCQAPHQAPGQPFKFTIPESLDRIKEEFQFLQAQYHRWITHTHTHTRAHRHIHKQETPDVLDSPISSYVYVLCPPTLKPHPNHNCQNEQKNPSPGLTLAPTADISISVGLLCGRSQSCTE